MAKIRKAIFPAAGLINGVLKVWIRDTQEEMRRLWLERPSR